MKFGSGRLKHRVEPEAHGLRHTKITLSSDCRPDDAVGLL